MSNQPAIDQFQAPLTTANGSSPVRLFVRELAEGQEVAAAFAVRERDRRTRKNGDDFLRLVIADCTGTVEAVAWEGVEDCFEVAAPGAVVWIEGRFSVHPQYGAKITIRSIRAAADVEFDQADLAEGPEVPPGRSRESTATSPSRERWCTTSARRRPTTTTPSRSISPTPGASRARSRSATTSCEGRSSRSTALSPTWHRRSSTSFSPITGRWRTARPSCPLPGRPRW